MKLKMKRHKASENLFEMQIQTLEKRGCPGHIPFLPVIPTTLMTLDDLMAMVRNENMVGYNKLDSDGIINRTENSSKPYYIYDVENGKSLIGQSPNMAKKMINNTERFSLITDEIIALTIHTDVLSRFHVWAVNSYYYKWCRIPFIRLDNDGRPKMDREDIDYPWNKAGSPSCGSR